MLGVPASGFCFEPYCFPYMLVRLEIGGLVWLMLTASQLLLTVLQVLLTFSRCWLRRRWGTGRGKQRGFRPQVSQLLSISPFLFSDGANWSFISYLGFGFGVSESKQVGFADLLTSLDTISRRRRWRAGRGKQRGFRPQVSQLLSPSSIPFV
jgi:hypothetical protein